MSALAAMSLAFVAAVAGGDRAGRPAQGEHSPFGDPTTRPIYAVAGVIATGTIDTSFHCSNLGDTNANVKIVVRHANGTVACNITDTIVEPGRTSTLSTGFTVLSNEDAVCAPVLGAAVYGSALITVDTLGSIDVVCTAHVLDGDSNPPGFMEKLDLYTFEGLPVSELLFADGFETGDTSRWELDIP